MKSEWKETDPIVKQFKSEVSDLSEEIDSADELCWLSLTVGWALAKGMDPETANLFAVWIRYSTDLG